MKKEVLISKDKHRLMLKYGGQMTGSADLNGLIIFPACITTDQYERVISDPGNFGGAHLCLQFRTK